ncbi:hypothetical protein B296_00044848 [Ensete ventricosum]|uniref:Uncharacterized protein n=1 Tax=Ensete ventricosum TaxID=4639 RepID=A0A426Y159_ENSVE|nr:hypothetical protein B296_00044848 [Ensete ventricosum]
MSGRSYIRWVCHTCVRSTSLCWVDRTASNRPRWRPSWPRAWGRGSKANICYIHFPPTLPPSPEDLLEAPGSGTDDKVSHWGNLGTELVEQSGSKAGLAEKGVSKTGLAEQGGSETRLAEQDDSEVGLAEQGGSKAGPIEQGGLETGLAEQGRSEAGLAK